MSLEENKALITGFFEDLRNGDPAAAAEKFDAERYYSHGFQGNLMETWKKIVATSNRLIDFEEIEEHMVAEGDLVVHVGTFEATHNEDLFGVPATGKRVRHTAMQMWRCADGKIVEHWGSVQEAVNLYEQLVD